MSRIKKNSKKRLKLVITFISLLFISMILRLGYLQLIRGKELKAAALNNWTKDITIKPKRGDIYDRNGKKLAISESSTTAWVDVSLIKNEEVKELVNKIAQILKLTEEEEKELAKKLSKKSGHEKLKQWVSKDEVEKLKELDIRGLQLTDNYKRYYPYNDFASHTIGFTDIDNNGLYGIEKTYDKYLRGKPGKWIKVTDSNGKQLPFEQDELKEADDGYSLILTLDETIQKLVEESIDKAMEEHRAKNISVIAIEPKTGEILALANRPSYNPNKPRESLDESTNIRWKKMKSEEVLEEQYDMWRNYAVNDLYEPGSTFKLITAAAAIEENKVNPNTGFYCNGFIRDIPGEELRCSSWYNPHGNLSFQEGLDSSCNIVFVHTARRLGRGNLLKYLKGFGFGEKTGIDLNGEEDGLIPGSIDSIKEINLATLSYGHGVTVTPIQLVNAVGAITNGGKLMKPRLVKKVIDSQGNTIKEFKPEVRRQVISEETSNTMLELMETVVSKGTGSNAYIDSYEVGGKTGTAEKIIDGAYVDGKYIGSFVAVAPIENPKIALLVIVDDPEGVYYGGTTAAPIAKEIIEGTLEYLNIEKIDGEDKEEELVELPNLKGKTIEEAGKALLELDLKYTTGYGEIDNSSLVESQSPDAGVYLPKGSVIDLELKKKTIKKMPDLKGKTKEEADLILKDLKLDYKASGEGKVVDQVPGPGEDILTKDSIELILE